MNAKDKRQQALTALLEEWIETQDPQCMGALITSDSWHTLASDVESLRRLGRSVEWQEGVTKWARLVDQMFTIFCEQEMGVDTEKDAAETSRIWGQGIGSYTHTTGREFARLIKFAVMQGLIYMTA